jgi:hypothetical protein
VTPRDAAAFEVRDALAVGGCAVCQLSLRSVARLLQSVAYEQVNDLDLRKALREAGGFCNVHAHQWLREAHNVLGTALIYRDVLAAALRELDAPRPGRLRTLLGGSAASAACPACAAQADAERRYLEVLLELVAHDPQLIEHSDGLCRRHTLLAVRIGGAASTLIAERTAEVVRQLIADLDEVIRKEDYRFRNEPRTPAERTAPARAVSWSAGTEGLARPEE